jgi:GNAT superfamily N-acetyltransferase
MKIRTATLRDLALLVRHRRGMFADLGVESTASDDRRYRAWARAHLKSGTLVGFIAGKASSGCVWLQPVQPRPGGKSHVPYLLSMYTEPEWRGRGLATRIVGAAMRWCRARGFARMSLHASTMGRRVYTKLGWKRTWEMKVDLA